MKFSIVSLTAILAAAVQAQGGASSSTVSLVVSDSSIDIGDGTIIIESTALDTTLVLATATDETATAPTSTVSISSADGIRSSSVESIDTILQTASGSPTIPISSETNLMTRDSTTSRSGTVSSSGDVQSTSTGTDAGAMPTAAIAMGAFMGGAALIANL